MMLLLIKTAFGLVVVTFCGVRLVRWWLNRRERVITHHYAGSDGKLLSWQQALSARMKDPLIVLVPLEGDSASRPCPPKELASPERATLDVPSTSESRRET